MEQQTHSQSKKKKRSQNSTSSQSDSNLLNDLQSFLSDEIFEQGTGYGRAFIPLTEGLGLESPTNLSPKIEISKQDVEVIDRPQKQIIQAPELPSEPKAAQQLSYELDNQSNKSISTVSKPDLRASENRLAEVMEPPILSNATTAVELKPTPPKLQVLSASDKKAQSNPPPLPRPPVIKRLLAGVIDHVFVLLIWTALIVISSNFMNDFSRGFSIEILTDFGQPRFQRMAVLEFAAAWFGYLGFSLLIARRTFGMWVWSIGVSYGDKIEENYTMRKAMRIFWTFLFSAPIIPSVVLMIHKNGRNILDVLSGTNVYDTN